MENLIRLDGSTIKSIKVAIHPSGEEGTYRDIKHVDIGETYVLICWEAREGIDTILIPIERIQYMFIKESFKDSQILQQL